MVTIEKPIMTIKEFLLGVDGRPLSENIKTAIKSSIFIVSIQFKWQTICFQGQLTT